MAGWLAGWLIVVFHTANGHCKGSVAPGESGNSAEAAHGSLGLLGIPARAKRALLWCCALSPLGGLLLAAVFVFFPHRLRAFAELAELAELARWLATGAGGLCVLPSTKAKQTHLGLVC
ncbi:hypothetical protein BD289DRAFT_172796 [Coniella lustricola]|uniref:Uncharacterized protein n=1 Tax=Coniella lustricola TaxID=2025994 RepID=A0A2T2ZTW9_9PEZI|nr:hypothetical protein BD289DRAFT_172796 [Coniella lustricola]